MICSKQLILSLIISILLSFKAPEKNIRYISLGDSYTICTGAGFNESWPVLLSKHLNETGINNTLVANPSRSGYSTTNLIDYELPVMDTSKADFATLLIGVNDWVRGINAQTFKKNLSYILDYVRKRLTNKKNLIVISIPDFGVTPQGPVIVSGRDISAGISEFNSIIKSEAKKRGLALVDIFEISKEMKNNPDLVASDGLHPSAKEYAIWESLIFAETKKLFSK